MREQTVNRDQAFEQQLQALLRSSETSLPEQQLRQLGQARRQALQADPPAARRRLLWSAVTTAFASVLLVAVMVSPGLFSPDAELPTSDEYLGAADTEFYEDLEFYQWLAERELNGDFSG